MRRRVLEAVPEMTPVIPSRSRPGLLLAWVALLAAACAPPEQGLAWTRREWVFERLGSLIGEASPGAAVLLVGNPYSQFEGAEGSLRRAEAASFRGLSRGLGKQGRLLEPAYPDLKPGARENPHSVPLPPGATTPISFLSAPGAWDRVRARHSEAGVLVSLIGFPADLAETGAWKETNGPRWVLYLPDLRLLGDRDSMIRAFRDKRLLAIVLPRPGAPPESEPPSSDRANDLSRRYVFVTDGNLDEMLVAWPGLFP